MIAVRWWVTHEPDRGRHPYALRCRLGGRMILSSYASQRMAVAMAPAFARALVQATRT